MGLPKRRGIDGRRTARNQEDKQAIVSVCLPASFLLVVPTSPRAETMKGAYEQMKWNVLWQLLQSRAGRMGLAPALWYAITLFTLAVVYFGTGRLGLSLGAVSSFATLVWLPSGLSVAALFLWGWRLWPAIALGAFLANHFTGAPWPV